MPIEELIQNLVAGRELTVEPCRTADETQQFLDTYYEARLMGFSRKESTSIAKGEK